MNKRIAQIERKTAETDIKLTLDLDGTGKSDVSTLCPFLDHMLTLFAHHGRFDLSLTYDRGRGNRPRLRRRAGARR